MHRKDRNLPSKTAQSDLDSFLRKVRTTPVAKRSDRPGRLIFAMDATASREPTWDQACHIQAQMFAETDVLGGLDVQLCFYRGFLEFECSEWFGNAQSLGAHMARVRCAAGTTQIVRTLRHAIDEQARCRVNALVFVGDCMEEDIDRVCGAAGKLGLLGVPVFMFHEGNDPVAERTFREVARLSDGAYCRFDASSGRQLRDLLSAVAVYAAGGQSALEDFGRRKGGEVRRLSHKLTTKR